MKTIKLLVMVAIIAAAIYSCSSDREEELQTPTSKSELDLKKLKTNNNSAEAAKPGDTLIMQPQIVNPGGGDPITNPNDPNNPEIIPPGDIKPPKP